MPDKVIDLRSDTVTKPSPAMRRAMAEAEVGDDVYLEDPTVNRLQDRAAEIFGREAGLFVPSGSMGNLACIMAQTQRGQEVICEAAGHVYNYEMASMSALGGVLPRLIHYRRRDHELGANSSRHSRKGVLSSAKRARRIGEYP